MQTNAWAGAGSSPTPGSLVSRRVGSGKRRRSGGARAEAPEVRGGRGLLREPVPRAGAGGQRVRGRPRRRDLSSRGASAREHAVVPAAPAPKLPRCAAGVDCFENPCLGWKERPKGSGLVPDAGICSFSSPRSASELIKAAAARAKADPDAPEGLPVDMARKTHKGAKGVAGALVRVQLATASLGIVDAMRRRSRRAPAAASSGPRTATRPRASRASCPGSTRSRTATSARCSSRATTTAAAPRLQMEDCVPRDSFGPAADVDVPSDSPLGLSKLAALLAPHDRTIFATATCDLASP